MKTLLVLAVPLVLLGGCASSRWYPLTCGNHAELPSTTTRVSTTVTLKPRPRDPSMYLIADHYVILMRPNDVVSLLEARVAQRTHEREDEILLAAIKAKSPLVEDTDLLKFSFTDRRPFERPTRIAEALLKSGSASVVDLRGFADEGTTLPSIVAMELEGTGGTWTDFCVPAGQSILLVSDRIDD